MRAETQTCDGYFCPFFIFLILVEIMVEYEDTRYNVMEEREIVELCVTTTSSEPSPRSFVLRTFTFNSGASKCT